MLYVNKTFPEQRQELQQVSLWQELQVLEEVDTYSPSELQEEHMQEPGEADIHLVPC